MQPKIRVSLSVEGFKDKAIKTLGLEEWNGNVIEPNEYVLFFGLYTKNDYDAFKIHQGKKAVFWCGSDILNLKGNYESRRLLKIHPAKHFCENEIEKNGLKECGVEAEIVPSFLGEIEEVSFKPSDKPQVFLCGHPNREEEYGWELIEEIAEELPEFTFHLYGVEQTEFAELPNIVCHGKVPEEQFNKEIKNYQCGLRPNEHDGNSEVTMKCLFNGGYPITRIPYEGIWNYQTKEELIQKLKELKLQTKPNPAREMWIKKVNAFNWE
jgi:hypothetical protein